MLNQYLVNNLSGQDVPEVANGVQLSSECYYYYYYYYYYYCYYYY